MDQRADVADVDEQRGKSALRRRFNAVATRLGVRLHDLYLGETDLRRPLPEIEPRVQIQVMPASEDDLDRIDTLLDESVRSAYRRNRTTHGRCLVARVDGAIAGWIWEHVQSINLSGRHLGRLPEGVAYTFGAYVLPRYRGARVFQYLIGAAAEDLRFAGCHTMWNLVNRSNVSAVGARRHLNTRFGRVLIVELPRVRPVILGRRITVSRHS